MDLLKKEFILLDQKFQSKEELFQEIATVAANNAIVSDQKLLIEAFVDRENLITTALEDGFAIPHARTNIIEKPAVFFIRNTNEIKWDTENGLVKYIIALLIPENDDSYLDTLSAISTKLLKKEVQNILQKSNDQIEIIATLSATEKVEEVALKENTINIVGLSACATGVAHTYIARTALLEAGKELNWNVSIETQGQKGQEFLLTDEQIKAADAVIVACDIGVELDRFNGKKIYQLGTKQAIKDPKGELQKALSKGVVAKIAEGQTGSFEVKDKKKWVSHIMNGISYMIPFIVFAGLISAILGGIAHAMNFDLNADNLSGGKLFLATLNQFAGIGFTVMMGVAGAYIANSIAGRSAIAPAFILTMAGNNPKLIWQGYFQNIHITNPITANIETLNNFMQPLNIIGAIIFGLAVGYAVKWINTKWKINKYIQPIMPIILIPVFLTAIFWIVWMFTFGPLMGIAIGYLNVGIMKMEGSGVGMVLTGLVLGLLAGVDMGGPINKIASFGATALIPLDNGLAMGCAAAAFGVAPLGCGLSALIFKKKFKDDHSLGLSTTILGFMGISEGAIPFATKYSWKAIVPNIVGSGVAGMIAGAFKVRGHVGAWGGPIIAIFGGVDNVNNSYIGILWYFLAIIVGTLVHILLFRTLIKIDDQRKVKTRDNKPKKLMGLKRNKETRVHTH